MLGKQDEIQKNFEKLDCFFNPYFLDDTVHHIIIHYTVLLFGCIYYAGKHFVPMRPLFYTRL